jgi:hypothetical protein
MAIPQGRLSSVPQVGLILPPEDRPFYGLISYEKGPIAIEDTTQGMLYQNWTMNWDRATGNLNLSPETVGDPTTIINLPNLEYFTFTWDQAGRVSLTYTDDVSSYLYWYDTEAGQTVTTDLGADVRTPSLSLDDRRSAENTVNDMLLWYIKGTTGNYNLYMRRQRDRFLNEYLMLTGLTEGHIHTVGMGDNFRVHLLMSGPSPIPEPPPVTGLTPSQILTIVNNAASIGFMSLYQFPQVSFDSLFGQSIDGPNVTAVIEAGQSFSVYPTVPGMGIFIENDPMTASMVTTLVCWPNGFVGGSNTYLGTQEGLYLPLQENRPWVIMVASNTGYAKITKKMIP